MKKLLRNLSVLCFVFAAFFATGCYEEELPFLTVDHEVVLVGPNMDKGTVVVESNVDWSVTSDVEWITIDNGFGNHKGTFEFFVDANTTPNERSGKIKLDGGTVSVTILVRQQSEGSVLTLSAEEIAFTKDAGEYLMSVACNGEWDVTSSADWCKVNPTHGEGNGSFKVTVEENTTGADRTAILSILTKADGKTEVRKVVVTQSASNAALVVSPESQELTAAASSFTLDVITTGNWEASLDCDWLTLSETSGSGDDQITVNAEANETGAPRIAVITFATGAENENRVIRQIVVKQAAVDFYLIVPVTDYPLSLDAQNIEIPFSVKGSNVDVKATSNVSWLKVGSVADGIATVAVDENKTAQPREGVITFMTVGQEGEPIVRQVRVAQAPTINVLDVLADEYAVEWVGATIRVPIYTNTPVSVRSSETWCSAISEGQDLVITVAKNETAMPRVAVVTVTTESESGEILSRTVIVRQAAAYSELVVTPETKNIYAVAQSFVATIVTNNSWTASSDSDWLTIDKAAGTGDYMLTVSAAANESGQVRIATITVQTGAENSQRESATITVTQRPEQFYFEIPTRFYAVDKFGGFFSLPYVTSGNEKEITASSSCPEWLGVGDIEDGRLNFTVTENKTAEVRTGVITVTCIPVFGDPISIDITVTQSPTVNILDVFVDVIDVSPRGDEVALPYYSNTPVSISSSEEWCHVEVTKDEDSVAPVGCCSWTDPQKIIKIEVDPNRTGEARVAYVTISTVSESGEKITKVITIRQAALYAALSVTPKNVVLPAHNGHFNLVINTTGTWAASTTCTWLHTEDDMAGFGDSEIFFEAGVNNTGAQREGDIIVATGPENNEREEQVVHVIQLERDTYIDIPISAYALTKDQQVLRVGYFAAGDFKDMQVNCSEDWITFRRRYSDDEHLGFEVEENTTAEPRTATVTVTIDQVVGEPLTDTFTVTQAPTVNILDVYVDFYEASPKGELIVFPFYSNVEVETSLSAYRDWLEVIPGTPNMNEDPNELAIRVKENTSAEARTGYVTLTTFTDKGEKLTHIITIHQNPLNASLIVTPEKVILPAHAVSAEEELGFTVTIATSGNWTVSTAADWIATETTTSSGDATVEFTVSDNNTGLQREAIVSVITGEENETRIEKTVQVIQLAADTYLDIPQEAYMIAKDAIPGLDNSYFEVACLVAGDYEGLVVDCSESWIKYIDYDADNNLLQFTVQENTTGEPRTATVTATIEKTSGEPYTDSFTVTQAGTYNFLEGLSDYVSVKPVEDTIKLPVLSNVENLRAVVSENWLKAKVNVDEDFDYAVVKIMAEANTTGQDREASVTLITETDKGQILEKKIMVFQPTTDTYFAILSGEEMVVRKAGKNVTISAYASVNADKITMESNSPWVKLNKNGVVVSEEDENIVSGKFKVEENNTGEIRTATVTVTFFTEAGAPVQKTVTITQMANDGGAFEALVNYLVVAPEGEKVKLYFATEDPLTVNVSAGWLNKTKMSDPATDPQTLIVNAEENNTGKDRTGYVIVSNGSVNRVITVFQPAKETIFALLSPDIIHIDATAGTVNITAFGSTVASVDDMTFRSDASWLTGKQKTIDGKKVTRPFAAEANPGEEAREASVKVTFTDQAGRLHTANVLVVQAGAIDDNILEALVDAVTLNPAGDTITLGFISSETLASAVSSSAWLESTPDPDKETVKLKAEANTTGIDRTAYVTLRNSKKTALITVFQPAADAEFTILTPSKAISSAKQEVVLRAYCSEEIDLKDVKISSDASWLTPGEKVLGSDERVVRVPVSASLNDTGSAREAVVTFTWIDEAGATHVGEATVLQSPTENILDVWVGTIMVPYYELIEKLPVFSNAKNLFARSSNNSWLKASMITNADNGAKNVKLTISENETGLPRTGVVTINVTFEDDTQAEKVITVVQQPKPAEGVAPVAENYLFLAVDNVTLPAEASEETVKVFTNATDYTVTENADWLTATKGSVKLAAVANEGTEARTAEVTVKATFADGEVKTETLTVTQAAPGAAPVEENYLNLVSKIEFTANFSGRWDYPVNTNATSFDNIKVNYGADQDWLTVEAENVDGVMTFRITPQRNTKPSSRTANLTFTAVFANGETLPGNVNIQQDAAQVGYLFVQDEIVLPMEGAELSAPITTNAPEWTFEAPADSWFLATAGANPDILTVSAKANTTGEERTGTVTVTAFYANGTKESKTVTIIQKATPDKYLTVAERVWLPSNVQVLKDPETAVYTNAESIAVAIVESGDSMTLKWVSPQVVEQPGLIAFKKLIGNSSADNRQCTMKVTATFADGTTMEKEVLLVQVGKPAEEADVYIYSSEEITFNWNESTAKWMSYFTNADPENVTLTPTNVDWFTPTLVAGSSYVKGGPKTNESPDERRTSYKLTATKDGTTAEFTVNIRQLGKPEAAPAPGYIECNLGAVEVESPATTVNVPFDTDAVSYTVTKDADWITVANESAISDNKANFDVRIKQNDSEKSRVGVVTVTATFADNSTKKYYLPVIQHPATRYFVVLNDHYDMDSNGAMTLYLPYISNPTLQNSHISVTTSANWISRHTGGSVSFITEHSLVFDIAANSGGLFTPSNTRTGTITITWTDPTDSSHQSTYIVTIVQPGSN